MAEAYFSEVNCSCCGSSSKQRLYRVDMAYAQAMSGIAIEKPFPEVCRCDNCGHQFINPEPNDQYLAQFYSNYMSRAKTGFYRDRYSEAIPESFRDKYSPYLRQIESYVEMPSRLLDIGSGLGMFLRLAKEYGYEVEGLEPNTESANRVNQEYGIKVNNMLLSRFDVSDIEAYQVVTMWDLLEHLRDPQKALEGVANIMSDNGVLVMEIPVRDSVLHYTAKMLYKASFGRISRPLYLVCGVHHLNYFSEQGIRRLLEDKGFRVLRAERTETNLQSLRRGGAQSSGAQRIFNMALSAMFSIARLLRMQNKLIIYAKKLA